MLRRAVIRVALFLLLGAIVNIAVAWILAGRPEAPAWTLPPSNVNSPYGRFILRDVFQTDKFPTGKTIQIRLGDFRAAHWVKRLLGLPGFQGWFDETRFPGAIPRWSRFHGGKWPLDALKASGETRDVDYAERASGWPMYALRYECIGKFWGPVATSNLEGSRGLLLIPDGWLPKDWQTDLPWLPIWLGFAVNTIFYAAILWLLFAAPFALRRWRRRQLGRCVKCDYDLRGRGAAHERCPECGVEIGP